MCIIDNQKLYEAVVELLNARRSGAGWVCENHPDVLGTIS